AISHLLPQGKRPATGWTISRIRHREPRSCGEAETLRERSTRWARAWRTGAGRPPWTGAVQPASQVARPTSAAGRTDTGWLPPSTRQVRRNWEARSNRAPSRFATAGRAAQPVAHSDLRPPT